tara:strand:+ start:2403 stop:2687 length:285 start_codon:yes stop_codon:yes gene_type:complete
MTNNNYKGYSLFNDVEDAALRTWNRCVVMCNVNKDNGEGFSEGYGECLDKVGKMQMMAMLQYIKVKGAEEVRKEINVGKHTTLENEVMAPEVVH